MVSSSIKNVVVIGASGNIGSSTVKALLEENFHVTGLTRHSSEATLPAGVKHIKSDYTQASLQEAFKDQDAVISTIPIPVPGEGVAAQKIFIDAAIAAGVKVFFPSEFGIDTSDPSAPDYIPFLVDKLQTVEYLKTRQDKISWTVIISGGLFDWSLSIPGFGGFNIPARTATIFDGGDIPFETTSRDQAGRAVAKSLKQPELTRNQYVSINSFTTTQNQILKALEKATGEKFTISHGTVEGLWQGGLDKVKGGQPLGVLDMVAGAVYWKGGLGNYSTTRGLWNAKLGLPEENLEEFVKRFIEGQK
ncbi:hypothetical protein F5884DRAFT_342708 [Xylogone sp. PMI_703]|nr:hypothetical protein F5884DRAFT_342708 [Xylogone sp. PMI_703]